ncbi:GTP pyrophosphokinase [Clostridium vincentii]|uniref:GTP pyrophosphokinase n=1 Tax=Clostridium vincentii TaxID=52704 RepID=UPI003BFA6A62
MEDWFLVWIINIIVGKYEINGGIRIVMRKLEKVDELFPKNGDLLVPKEIKKERDKMEETTLIYRSALREISTKLNVLDDEFRVRRKRNPIEYMKSRVKSIESIMEKLKRRGFEVGVESAKKNLNDIAGIRVVCSFVSDIYEVAELLKGQYDVTLVEEKDYIKAPKANGYRSLHMVVQIPIFLSDHVANVRVEVQIRTIAMDFWASLEHKLYYKIGTENHEHIRSDLKECADVIASTDMRMQEIQREVEKIR